MRKRNYSHLILLFKQKQSVFKQDHKSLNKRSTMVINHSNICVYGKTGSLWGELL